MFGLNIQIQCPYCKKILHKNIGITRYYDYHGNEVVLESHEGCGDFLCIPEEERTPMDEIKRYVGANTRFYDVVREITRNYMKQGCSEEDIIQNTLRDLREKLGSIVVDPRIDDMKLLIQVVLGQQEPSLWSIPLTKEIEDSLEVKRVVCW